MKRRMSGPLGLLVAAGLVLAAVAATIAVAASGGASAQAAGSMQMSLTGVPAFQIRSYEFEFEADSSWSRGGGASVGKPQVGPFIFTKAVDGSIDDLISTMTRAKRFEKGELTVTWGTGDRLTYSMTEMLVTKVTETAEGGRPVDTVELVFKTLAWKLGSASGSYDVPANKTT
jgi:type VI protein secretion system component Hcp